jgi:hypothetical protein
VVSPQVSLFLPQVFLKEREKEKESGENELFGAFVTPIIFPSIFPSFFSLSLSALSALLQ